MENKRIVINNKEHFKATVCILSLYIPFAILMILGLVAMFLRIDWTNLRDWTNFVSAFLCSFVLIVVLIWPVCHLYKLTKIILEDDEIILSYSFLSFSVHGALLRPSAEEKKYEKRRYIEEKGKKKFFRFILFFRFIFKYHLKCSEIVGYESGSFLTLYPANKETGKKTTEHVYRKIPIASKFYTIEQLMCILTRIRENGGLQGDAYDNAINKFLRPTSRQVYKR